MGKKGLKNLFETDLRKDQRSPYVHADDMSRPCLPKVCSAVQVVPTMGCSKDNDQLDGNTAQPPKMTRMDSYRVQPLKTTLETIEEDKPRYESKPDYLVRSKSLPAQRRSAVDRNALAGLHKLPSYRHGYLAGLGACDAQDHAEDGTFFAGQHGRAWFAGNGDFRGAEGGFGVTMSGPILSTPGGEYKYYTAANKRYRPRLSAAKMREAVRNSRIRGAISHILSRMRPTSRSRSH